MAELLGFIASITQLAELTVKTVGYVDKVKHGPKERKQIGREGAQLFALLTNLKYQTEESKGDPSSQPWQKAVESLKPLMDQLKGSLEELAAKLDIDPESYLKKFGKQLIWPIDERKCKDILGKIERLKSLISLVLQQNITAYVEAIKEDTKGIPEVKEKVIETLAGVDELRLDHDAQLRSDILAWLSSLNFLSRQDVVRDQRQQGTGSWVLDSPAFKSWLERENKILWCPGIPGAGKTIMVSLIVDELNRHFAQSDDVALACVYFDHNDRDRQALVDVISDIYKQLLYKQEVIPKDLARIDEDCQRRDSARPKLAQFTQFLQSEIQRRGAVYIVIDALDECEEEYRSPFLEILRELGPNVSLLVTSRFLNSISEEFDGSPTLEIAAQIRDMETYIRNRVKRERRLLKHVAKDPLFEDEIVRTIVNKAQKMFLLARLHLDSLSAQTTRRDVRNQLSRLPQELDGTYNNAWDRIKEQKGPPSKLAGDILCWTCFACRPLKIQELRHALAVQIGDSDFDEDNLLSDDGDINSCCAGLISAEETDGTVRFIHYSTQEYFTRKSAELFPTGQVYLARVCLTYLSFRQILNSQIDRSPLQNLYPLIGYAARHWGTHARGTSEHDPDTQSLVLALLGRESRPTDDLMVRPPPEDSYDPHPNMGWNLRGGPKGFHIAASFGLSHILLLMIQNGTPIDLKDRQGMTALHWSCWNDHYETTCFLIDRKANINARTDQNDATPLIVAALQGNGRIVKLLLEHGADVNADCKTHEIGSPALHEACYHGRYEIAELLLENGASTSQRAGGTQSPLDFAAQNGHVRLIQLLLGHEAGVTGYEGWTALRGAIYNGRTISLEALLSAGVDPSFAPKGRKAPLDYALELGNVSVLETLIKSGARPSIPWRFEDAHIQRMAGHSMFKSLLDLLTKTAADTRIPDQLLPDMKGPITRTWSRNARRNYSRETPKHKAYLQFVIPEEFPEVQRIVFRTESHDQGWSDYRHCWGTYAQSYTWFDARITHFPSGEEFEKLLQYNVHASSEMRVHVNMWDRDEDENERDGIENAPTSVPHEATDHAAVAACVRRIRPGDLVQIFARARYVGWVNHVGSVEVEVIGVDKARSSDEEVKAVSTKLEMGTSG